MKKFVFRLLTISVAIVLIVIGAHLAAVLRLQDRVDKVYSFGDDGADILFVGSSEIGCSIEESARFHNRCIWLSSTVPQSFQMRLNELNSRNQLEKIKVCIVPFSMSIIIRQNPDNFKWAWYQELPISWRYVGMFPCSWMEFGSYVACNLRWPFPLSVSDHPPQRPPLAGFPANFRQRQFDRFARELGALSLPDEVMPRWRENLLACYLDMQVVCRRNGVRFIVLYSPFLPSARKFVPEVCWRETEDFVRKLRAAGVEVIDLPLKLDENHFIDYVHLVPESASYYTEMLYRQMGWTIGESHAP